MAACASLNRFGAAFKFLAPLPHSFSHTPFTCGGSSAKYLNRLNARPRHTSSPCSSRGRQLTAAYRGEEGDIVRRGYDCRPAGEKTWAWIRELFAVAVGVAEGP